MPPSRKRPPAGPRSPELDSAVRASARYDSAALKGLGSWMTVVMTRTQSVRTLHDTQAKAYAWIGLSGGRNDNKPPAEGNGLKVVRRRDIK